jgi:acetoin utilization deacetylase AcuC-like enzyme
MNKTGIVTDPLYIKHNPGLGHPESPARLESIYSKIKKTNLYDKLQEIPPRPATREEICYIHQSKYYQQVEQTDGREVSLDPDTTTSADSFRAAELAAGGTLALVEAVVQGEIDNGYALVRPPGHHAEHNRAMGFCLFNNVAIAAEYALKKLGLSKVLIVDWDLHHGNGTMHSFNQRSDVVYFSTHQYPYYPGTGAIQDIGIGQGAGYTINVPLATGMGDTEYRAVFVEILAPIVKEYSPDLMLISTGFDTYYQDPLGGMKMTAEGYGMLSGELINMANQACDGKLVFVLEGGYNLEGLSNGVIYCLQALLGEYTPPPHSGESGLAKAYIQAVKQTLSAHWKF